MGEHDSHGDCAAWTTLIIKNADGTSRDHQLVVDLEKDVAELKRCLRETYPGHPKEDRMKLVFSGRSDGLNFYHICLATCLHSVSSVTGALHRVCLLCEN